MAKGYRGELTPERTAQGVAAARRNARRLVQDARLLLDASRWPSAFMLAVLAIEEAGKEPLIRHILLMPEGVLRERAWKAFADHKAKNVMAAFTEFAQRGARTLDDFEPMIDPKSAHAGAMDELKQSATYVAASGAGWTEPEGQITESMATQLVKTAEWRVAVLRERTADEYRIWQRHVGPALRMGDAATRIAVAAAYLEMADAGVVTHDEAQGMIAFVKKRRADGATN